ncbi:MAG: IS3 family transposase [Firmicutes bacterium]|nr:IS3 family transposase [Bacillota bacterium]
MGSVGDALDNAVAESFFATLQTELLDLRTWLNRRMLTTAVFEYIEAFYNRLRHHSTLGYLSPIEYERRWTLNELACEKPAAWPKMSTKPDQLQVLYRMKFGVACLSCSHPQKLAAVPLREGEDFGTAPPTTVDTDLGAGSGLTLRWISCLCGI